MYQDQEIIYNCFPTNMTRCPVYQLHDSITELLGSIGVDNVRRFKSNENYMYAVYRGVVRSIFFNG